MRLARIEADGQALNAAADALETRLLADQSRVALWEELKDRHQHVSALATQNADAHLDAMVRYFSQQEERGRAIRHRRVASADPFDLGGGSGKRGRTHLSDAR